MPALEVHIAKARTVNSKLRNLLEKPNAVILRRNYCDLEHHNEMLRDKVRVNAVLAVDVTHPPKVSDEDENDSQDDFSAQFCKGLELWAKTPGGPIRVFLDKDELNNALTLFDAYARVENFEQAFRRLNEREIGLTFRFQEGVEIGVHGMARSETMPEDGLAALSPIVEVGDEREPCYVLRLENGSIGNFEQVMRDALQWLEMNSYQNVLGA